MGYSSLFNISNDGSEKFIGNYVQPVSEKFLNLFKKLPKIISYKFFKIDNSNFDTIYLDISFENYETLLKNRDEALDRGHAISLDFDEVKSSVWFNGQEKEAEVRLKGILDTHWLNKRRMSLKVKLKNGDTILGYNEFSLQKPRERQWPHNYVFEKFLENFGILSTNSNFLNVVVNGEKWGIMLAEESLGKIFLENKQKKESLIFKFGDERVWFEGWAKDSYFLYRLGDPTLNYHVYDLKKKINNSRTDNHFKNRQIISYVVENFSNYNSKLFNSSLMVKSFFISEAWGQFHALLNNNTSYYFNPYTLELEPIIRDQYAIDLISDKKDIIQWPPPTQFLKSLETIENQKEFINIINSLEKDISIIDNEFLYAKKLFPVDALKDSSILKRNISTINKDKDEFLFFNPKEYYTKYNNDIILDFPKSKSLRKFDEAKHDLTQKQFNRLSDLIYINHYTNGEIKFFNLLPFDVIVEQLLYNKTNILNDKLIIPSYLSKDKSIKIKTKIEGFQDEQFTVVSSFKGKLNKSKNKITLINNVKNPLNDTKYFPNFIIKKSNNLLIPKGTWVVEKDLFLSGNLVIEPGTIIKIAEGASIIINGNIQAIGSSSNKIIFKSLSKNWNGIYVYNSPNLSELSNVIIKGTSGINENILNLTGGTVFYNANVKINNVIFLDNFAEDGLNIINSEFIIENSNFLNMSSDAFDSDFSSGLINNVTFENINGDATDFSGSNVKIKNIKTQNVKDKAISAGEASNLEIINLISENVGVGVASKDGSTVKITNCSIKDSKLIAFMTYIKKKNYSSPSMNIKNCKVNFTDYENYSNLDNINDLKYFRQKGTSLNVFGISNIVEKDLNVDLLYETSIMKK